MPLSKEDKAEVQELIASGTKAYFESDEVKKAQDDRVAAAVGTATKDLTASVTTLTDTVKKIGEAAPKGDPKDDDKNKAGGKPDPVTEAVKAALQSELGPIKERLAKEDAERNAAKETADRAALVESTLKELKHADVVAKHPTFVASLKATPGITAAQIKDRLTAYKAEMKGAGIEIKETVASPGAENANAPTPESEEAAALAKIAQNAKNRPSSLAEVGKPNA